ncbi:WD40 repeat domain-containing serine/threonine protein kinase [Zavarzinella formosa]|uniref:WD40 repeat domain-containing serine/threonine protein kinase n=1 Tax=Zavarzinella formosa TaxID=360055 RepID=UPI0002F928BA|nr:protein kinase [Zavarzinella formosa]
MAEPDEKTIDIRPPIPEPSADGLVREFHSPPQDATHEFVPDLDLHGRLTLTGDIANGRTEHIPVTDVVREAVPGYEIERELGRGGMGVVYLARQTDLNRQVALKMILSGEHASASERDRFITEAKAVAALQHPNIVQIFEIGEVDGRPYLAFEYIGGGTLGAVLDGLPWPAKPAARVVEALARTVHFAHTKGIVHRDLKPANILLTEKLPKASDADAHMLKLTDFGLAKRLERESTWSGDGGYTPVDGPTRTGAVIGTPSYIAPEQAAGKNRDIGPAVDTYALGAILYEFLTGRPPFRGETALDTVLQVMADDPVPPSKLRAKCPRDLETICLKCLQKDPRKRYTSSAALAGDLRCYLSGEAITARPVGRRERLFKWMKRHPAGTVLGVTSSLALIGLFAVSIWFNFQLQNVADREEENAKNARAAEHQAIVQKANADAERVEAQKQKALADEARHDAEKKRREAERGVYALQLFKAAALADRDPQRALRMIEDVRRCPEELRDFTWRLLKAQCRVVEHIIGVHRAADREYPVTRVSHSPDGSLVVSASWDETARVWDVSGRKLLWTLAGHRHTVCGAAFSPDGRLVATCGDDNTVRLWEIPVKHPDKAEVLKPFATLTAHTDSVKAVVFDPSGDRLASAGADGIIRIWDVPSPTPGKPRAEPKLWRSLPGHNGPVWSLAWSVAGLFSGGQDGTVRHWDPDEEKKAAPVLFRLPKAAKSLAASSDGELIAAAGDSEDDPVVQVYRPLIMKDAGRLRGHTGDINGLSFAPDGKRLASCGRDGTVRLWDIAELRERAVFRPRTRRDMLPIPGADDRRTDPEKQVASVTFAPDGNSVLSGGLDGMIRQWDFASQREESTDLDVKAPLVGAVVSENGTTLAVVGKQNLVKVWKLGPANMPVKAQPDRLLRGLEKPARCLAVSEDGETIAVGGEDDIVLFWRLRDPEPKPVRLLGTAAVALAIHGHRMAVATETGQMKWFDFRTNKLSAGVVAVTARPNHFAFSHDGKKLVSAGGRFLQVWDAETGTWMATVPMVHFSPVTAVTIAPGDTTNKWTMATADFRGEIKVWDVAPRTEGPDENPDRILATQKLTLRTSMNIINDPVRSLAFTRDGRTLASGGADRVVRLWDPETGQERAALPGHADSILLTAFRTDFSLLTVGREGSAREWNGQK